jgi:glutaredoxin
MGRIKIFTTDGCSHCTRTKVAFEHRGMPYTEISLIKYPHKIEDMRRLSGCMSTPQVFFNTRYIGGTDDTLKILEEWDAEKENGALERFKEEVENLPDPDKPCFNIPQDPRALLELIPSLREDYSVVLSDDAKFSVYEMTEILKEILPCQSKRTRSMKTYENVFTCEEAVKALKKRFHLKLDDAISFGRQLQKQIHHVFDNEKHEFSNSSLFFRL